MIKWFKKTQTPTIFENHTLIIPAVSVGHVGQLTIDLVLENARADDNPKKVAQIFHAGLEPVVASSIVAEPSESGGSKRKHSTKTPAEQHDKNKNQAVKSVDNEDECLMTACEVYHCPKKQWVVLQFHSAIRKRDREKFVSFLLDWVREARFQMIACFSSTFTSERLDANITGLSSRVQVLYTDKVGGTYLEKIKTFGWTRLLSPTVLANNNLKRDDVGPLDFIEENLSSANLSGSGLTKSLLLACQSNGVPCLTLMVYASDGDNTVDALLLYKEASHLFQFLPLPRFGDPPCKIKIPYVWHAHLGVTPRFGTEDEEQIVVSTSARSRRKKHDDPPNTIY